MHLNTFLPRLFLEKCNGNVFLEITSTGEDRDDVIIQHSNTVDDVLLVCLLVFPFLCDGFWTVSSMSEGAIVTATNSVSFTEE